MEINELIQVLKEQQFEARTLRSECRPREVMSELHKMLPSRLIKVVMGIRRSGKSTLCIGTLPDKTVFSYCNFDDERLVGLSSKDLNSVYEALLTIQPKTEVFIFDEIQNVDGWELFVNRLQRKKINILITGSNGKLLSHELATHLTGRHLSLEIMPLSFAEYLRFQSVSVPEQVHTEQRALIKNHLQQYFENGGFPEVALGEDNGPYLRELFDKIISRDIAQRYRLRGSTVLKEMALYLIQQSGHYASLQNLKKTFEISGINTVRAYLQYLLDSYLIYEVPAYSFKVKERSTSPRKVYSCDLGLWSALNTKPTKDLGMKLETLTFLHLRRTHPQIFYLKDQGIDVDFCVLKDRKPHTLIQSCYSLQDLKTRQREVNSICAASTKYKTKKQQIITWDEETQFCEQGVEIEVLPVWKFLLSMT